MPSRTGSRQNGENSPKLNPALTTKHKQRASVAELWSSNALSAGSKAAKQGRRNPTQTPKYLGSTKSRINNKSDSPSSTTPGFTRVVTPEAFKGRRNRRNLTRVATDAQDTARQDTGRLRSDNGSQVSVRFALDSFRSNTERWNNSFSKKVSDLFLSLCPKDGTTLFDGNPKLKLALDKFSRPRIENDTAAIDDFNNLLTFIRGRNASLSIQSIAPNTSNEERDSALLAVQEELVADKSNTYQMYYNHAEAASHRSSQTRSLLHEARKNRLNTEPDTSRSEIKQALGENQDDDDIATARRNNPSQDNAKAFRGVAGRLDLSGSEDPDKARTDDSGAPKVVNDKRVSPLDTPVLTNIDEMLTKIAAEMKNEDVAEGVKSKTFQKFVIVPQENFRTQIKVLQDRVKTIKKTTTSDQDQKKTLNQIYAELKKALTDLTESNKIKASLAKEIFESKPQQSDSAPANLAAATSRDGTFVVPAASKLQSSRTSRTKSESRLIKADSSPSESIPRTGRKNPITISEGEVAQRLLGDQRETYTRYLGLFEIDREALMKQLEMVEMPKIKTVQPEIPVEENTELRIAEEKWKEERTKLEAAKEEHKRLNPANAPKSFRSKTKKEPDQQAEPTQEDIEQGIELLKAQKELVQAHKDEAMAFFKLKELKIEEDKKISDSTTSTARSARALTLRSARTTTLPAINPRVSANLNPEEANHLVTIAKSKKASGVVSSITLCAENISNKYEAATGRMTNLGLTPRRASEAVLGIESATEAGAFKRIKQEISTNDFKTEIKGFDNKLADVHKLTDIVAKFIGEVDKLIKVQEAVLEQKKALEAKGVEDVTTPSTPETLPKEETAQDLEKKEEPVKNTKDTVGEFAVSNQPVDKTQASTPFHDVDPSDGNSAPVNPEGEEKSTEKAVEKDVSDKGSEAAVPDHVNSESVKTLPIRPKKTLPEIRTALVQTYKFDDKDINKSLSELINLRVSPEDSFSNLKLRGFDSDLSLVGLTKILSPNENEHELETLAGLTKQKKISKTPEDTLEIVACYRKIENNLPEGVKNQTFLDNLDELEKKIRSQIDNSATKEATKDLEPSSTQKLLQQLKLAKERTRENLTKVTTLLTGANSSNDGQTPDLENLRKAEALLANANSSNNGTPNAVVHTVSHDRLQGQGQGQGQEQE